MRAAVVLTSVLIVAGCDVVASGPDDELAGDIETPDVEIPFEDADEVAWPEDGPSEFAADRPCGDRTIAGIGTQRGGQLFFCDMGDEVVGVLEVTADGTPPEYVPSDGCLAETFRRLAPGKPVPEILERECFVTGKDSDTPAPAPIEASPFTQLAAGGYCGANGAANFQADFCPVSCPIGGGCDSRGCRTGPIGRHQRTCRAQLNNWCIAAREKIASCNGTTRFRAWSGKDKLGLRLDYDVLAGQSASWTMIAPERRRPQVGWHKRNFRYRGDSATGAFHRYAFGFDEYY